MLHRLALVALGLAVLAGAAAALAVGGGGGGAATAGATVDTVNDSAISLSPADGPNGNYTSEAGDELALDLDSLNDDAETTAHEVFLVNATANAPTDVSVHSDAAGVSFYWADDPTANATDARTLQPNGAVAVGVAVDTVGDAESGTFTVRAEPATTSGGGGGGGGGGARDPPMTVRNVTVEPREVATGGTVTIAATVVNPDLLSQEASFGLRIDGRTVDRRTGSAWGGETTTVVFERTFQQPGEYAIGVGEYDAGTVTVTQAADGAGFEVTNASIEPTTIQAGQSATVAADVRNLGDEPGTFTAELSIGGTVLDTRPVRIGPGRTERVSFERTFERRGGYDVAIGGESAGTVQVDSATGTALRRYGSEYGWLVGALTVPAAGGALAVARRRQPTWG